MSGTYDVIIVGAGSVGAPTAYFLADAGFAVAVFDPEASAGRGDNRAAIGGIRATHSDRAKISICQESLDIFAGWEERTGDPIGWRRGGYTFVAYDDAIENVLTNLVVSQKQIGLDIDWVDADRVRELVPGIAANDLRGGTFSPGDGSASPLMCAHSFSFRAAEKGADFHYREPVTDVRVEGGRVVGITTAKGTYDAPIVINAAGAAGKEIGAMCGVDVPVMPDSHEAGITESVDRFFEPMVVDLRPAAGSKNYYFYQNSEGQIVFCITPDPIIPGTDRRATSDFLPMIATRMVSLMPRLANLKIRRTWRGTYPMTPDGFPIVGWAQEVEGFLLAAGMCGQGYMLGPGIGALLTRLLKNEATDRDREALTDLRPDRSFTAEEALK
ncbi:MAG: FAD-binding oxidoreductase [Planctomycetota bacterium]